jgi:hypothetical protein
MHRKRTKKFSRTLRRKDENARTTENEAAQALQHAVCLFRGFFGTLSLGREEQQTDVLSDFTQRLPRLVQPGS